MRNRLPMGLFGIVCCISLMLSCGGGGGGGIGGSVSVATCSNCISVDAPVIAFGDVIVAPDNYQEKTVLVQNSGARSLIIGQIANRNPVATPFRIWSDECSNSTLAPNQICAIKVRFSPAVEGGGLADTFDIPSNDPNTVVVSVSGNGIPAPPPPIPPPPANINVSSTLIAFGDVDWNTSSDRTITVRNTGSLNLEIGQIALDNPLVAPFGISSDACSNSTLGANKTCTLVVRFSPTNQATVVWDAFDLPSNDPGKPTVNVIVSGSGKAPAAPPPPVPPPPTINVSPNNLSFGNVVWNSFSEQTIRVQNTASVGSSLLEVGQIAQADPLGAPFGIMSDSCSGMGLAPTEICSLRVRFSPTSQGTGLSDSFDIPSNDPNKPSLRVDVGGNGRGLRVSINEVGTDNCPGDISLLVSVSDRNGNPVLGLSQDNMSLSENGVSKGVTGFSSVPSPIPVSVALVLDYSGSMTGSLPDVRTSSKGFIDQLLPGDEAAVFTFFETIQQEQAFTDNNVALKLAIDAAYITGTKTVVFDALWSAIDNVAAQAKPLNNRAIILISDGRDENSDDTGPGSVKTLSEVIAHAQANEVSIFAIGLGSVLTDVMTSLANETGGQYFPAPDSTQLPSIYTAIRNIIAGEYTMTYVPSAAPGGSVLLNVFVNSNGLQGEVSRMFAGCP